MWAVILFAVSALSAIGWGSLLAKVLRIQPGNGERGMLGLLCYGVLAAIIHVAIPLSDSVQAVLLGCGLACLALRRRETSWIDPALAAIACVSVLLHDNILPLYDNGLYHLQTIFWNTDAPLTPGVANLHGRLGFNSLLFLIAPIVDEVSYGWIANALAAAFVLLGMLERLRESAHNELSAGAFWFLICAIAIFALSPAWLAWLGVLNADALAATLTVYCIYLLFEYQQDIRRDTTPALFVLIGTLAVMVKISTLPLLAAGVLVCGAPRRIFPPARAVLVAVAVMTIWSARGVVMTGCAAYPIPQTCIYALPWTVSAERVDGESSGIRSWARMPGRVDYHAVLASWEWFDPWLVNVQQVEPVPRLKWTLPLGVAALLVRIFTRRRVDAGSLRVFSVVALCVVWWFWAAPDPRFGSGFLASLSIVALTFAVAWLPGGTMMRTYTFRAALVLLMAAAGDAALRGTWRATPIIPKVRVTSLTGPSGIAIRVPVQGDQCWDQAIPCIPPYYVDQDAFRKVRWRTIGTGAGP